MDDVVIASTEADAAAVEAVVRHHAQLEGALATLVESLVSAASSSDPVASARARAQVVDWCRSELLPHAAAEEGAMYPAARAMSEGRLLVEGMLEEHRCIAGLVDEIDTAPDAVRAAAAATALRVLFTSHLGKENELILPLLAAAADVALADLLGGMHDLLGADEPREQDCACGESDPVGLPELDARQVPHAIRHATIFGALEAVGPGGGLVLVAPHDPQPMLAQLEQRAPGRFRVEYAERGPEAWRLRFTRRTPS